VDGVQSVRRGDSYGDFGSQGDTLGRGRVYLGLLDNQAEKLALVADTVWRIVVLLAPLPPNLGDILIGKLDFFCLGY
jgi:hypothetical protein